MQFEGVVSKTGLTSVLTYCKFYTLCICRVVNEHMPWFLQQASESKQHQILSRS